MHLAIAMCESMIQVEIPGAVRAKELYVQKLGELMAAERAAAPASGSGDHLRETDQGQSMNAATSSASAQQNATSASAQQNEVVEEEGEQGNKRPRLDEGAAEEINAADDHDVVFIR